MAWGAGDSWTLQPDMLGGSHKFKTVLSSAKCGNFLHDLPAAMAWGDGNNWMLEA